MDDEYVCIQRSELLDDIAKVVNTVEEERRVVESAAERVLMVVDIIVLPFAIGLMFLVQLWHIPSIVAPAEFIPNVGYMAVRICKRLELAPRDLIRLIRKMLRG